MPVLAAEMANIICGQLKVKANNTAFFFESLGYNG